MSMTSGRDQQRSRMDLSGHHDQRHPARSGWIFGFRAWTLAMLLTALPIGLLRANSEPVGRIDFNQDVRRILSENCFRCHGPDGAERKGRRGGLRLDISEGALRNIGGAVAIVPGSPDASDLIQRIESSDPDELMPPPETGQRLSQKEIAILRRWIEQGAEYQTHWAYVPPVRPPVPEVRANLETAGSDWGKQPIDAFVLARLKQEGLTPAPEADRRTLIRRAALDLTGLPPTADAVDSFLADTGSGAFERVVDRLLRSDAYGEHWAHFWLDQARYADSSGYADDPGRTIWAYRDYVIRSFNANKPFDVFTIEQIAGDLLPNSTEEQIVATAFHRNTMTNNEGGTSDEEFRNVAVVDRVNTTMEVWMATTMACAQCHDHKYDPISQEEYFRLFAILNNTADADRADEAPTLPLYTQEQKAERHRLQEEIRSLEQILRTTTPALAQSQQTWETRLLSDVHWVPVTAQGRNREGSSAQVLSDGSLLFEPDAETDRYTLDLDSESLPERPLTAFRLEVLPDDRPPGRGVGHAGGAFVLTGVGAELHPSDDRLLEGQYLRIELPGERKILSLAEVQIFGADSETNLARQGVARQSSTSHEGVAERAIDGDTDGDYAAAASTTHTETSKDPWWEVDLQNSRGISRIVVWNRTDGAQERLKDFDILLLDSNRETVWRRRVTTLPKPSVELTQLGVREIPWIATRASYEQPGFEAASLLPSTEQRKRRSGWAVGPRFGDRHSLDFAPQTPVSLQEGHRLRLTLDQMSEHPHATLARVRVWVTSDERMPELLGLPDTVFAALHTPLSARTPDQTEALRTHYLAITETLQPQRDQLATARQALEGLRPHTTVPILRELAGEQRRTTHVHLRGNFLDPGKEVVEGLPEAFHPVSDGSTIDRLTLARWLVDRNNPLTARVLVNRLWGALFGTGLVRTSEEFGAQGELPTHPELLDWLAVELMDSGWNIQHILHLITTSATYRQTSAAPADLVAQDPDNRLLARGPRFRLSAETIRDQAMALSGLLSRKMYGPPVKPYQPRMGLSAAFGSGTDWETSAGEDQYRRGVYTTWRRSNPYPSMATFDAPNREVCVVQRDRSNTPLQALVTLNDPVYVEAAQHLAGRILDMEPHGTPAQRIRVGFETCLNRPPKDVELVSLLDLYSRSLARFGTQPDQARLFAGLEESADHSPAERAAWTLVANVLLNLDELLMKP